MPRTRNKTTLSAPGPKPVPLIENEARLAEMRSSLGPAGQMVFDQLRDALADIRGCAVVIHDDYDALARRQAEHKPSAYRRAGDIDALRESIDESVRALRIAQDRADGYLNTLRAEIEQRVEMFTDLYDRLDDVVMALDNAITYPKPIFS